MRVAKVNYNLSNLSKRILTFRIKHAIKEVPNYYFLLCYGTCKYDPNGTVASEESMGVEIIFHFITE